ncbi:MAG TPA: hypothetical protein VNB59_02920 [Solirubrobacterales bacterium]|jgi:hypothetical protein|nr:hypothetical protein [Solirubrobacterales bacterium]
MQAGRRSAGAVVLTLLLAAMVLPATASAKPGYFVYPAEKLLQLHLRGSHGYSIRVSGYDEGSVTVEASKGKSAVTYFLRGKLHRNRINARLPGVGRIALRFHSKVRTTYQFFPGCKGDQAVVVKGIFTGTVHLRGERGFTRARATRVRGKELIQPRVVCKSGSGGGGDDGDFRFTILEAEQQTSAGTIDFSASRFEFGDEPNLSSTSLDASLIRKRGGMTVFAVVFDEPEDPGVFAVDGGRRPRTAAVGPHGPFSGNATFERRADGSFIWTGTLSIEFPNLGQVALAGPDFSSRLCVQRSCEGDLQSGGNPIGGGTRPWLRAAAPTPNPWPRPGSPR